MEVCSIARSKCASPSDRVNLFDVPETDFSYMLGDYRKFELISGSQGSLLFEIGRDGAEFYDLSDSFVRILVTIVKADGSDLSDSDKIAPENFFFHTLFQRMDAGINGSISNSMEYAYVAWMNAQLQSGLGEKSSMLSSEIYYPGPFDKFDSTNPSFTKRLALGKNSKTFEMLGRPMHGLFTTSKFLSPGAVFTLEMVKSTTGFHLSGPATTNPNIYVPPYLVDIKTAQFYVRKITVNPKISTEIQQTFSKGKNSFYPYDHYSAVAHQIPDKMTNYRFEIRGGGALPKLVCIGFTTVEAYRGRAEKSPFNFRPHGLSRLKLTQDAKAIVYQELNFGDEGYYMLGYKTLCKLLPAGSDGNNIDYEKYIDGNTMFVFDLQSLCRYGYNPTKRGQLGVEVFFSSPPTESLMAIVMTADEMGTEVGGRGGGAKIADMKEAKY
jgi:hypothetical protein